MSAHTEADMTDARDVLSWLLTHHAATLHGLALRLAQGDAGMTAIVSNAGRAWNDACAALAQARPATSPDGPPIVVVATWTEGDALRQEAFGPFEARHDESHHAAIAAFLKGWAPAHGELRQVVMYLVTPADGEQHGGGRG